MHCFNCGELIPQNVKFCPKCGQKIVVAMPPQAEEPAESEEHRQRRSPRRWFVSCLALTVMGVLLCAGGSIFLYYRLGFHQTNETARIASAEDTMAFATFRPSLTQVFYLQEVLDLRDNSAVFAPLLALPAVSRTARLATESLPTDAIEVDVAQDLLPWLGREVSLAILADPSRTASHHNRMTKISANGTPDYAGPPLVLAAVTRNPGASTTFLVKIREQMEAEGVVFTNKEYRNILMTEIAMPRELPLAYAIVDNLVIFASDVIALERTIDSMLDEQQPVLAETAEFQSMISSLPANRLGLLYLDSPLLLEGIPEEVQPWQLRTIDRMAISLGLADEGVRLDYALHYPLNDLTQQQLDWLRGAGTNDELADQVPPDCLFYLAGDGLSLLWESTFEERNDVQALILEVEKELGFQPDIEEFIQLADDGYAWIGFEDTQGLLGGGQIPLNFLFLAPVQERRQAEDRVADLQEVLAAMNLLGPLNKETVNGIPVTMVEYRPTKHALGYGFNGDDILFVGTSENVLRAATYQRMTSLADSEPYTTVNGAQSRRNRAFLYVDIARLRRLMERSLDDDTYAMYRAQVQPYIEQMQAAALGIEPVDETGHVRGVVSIMLTRE